MPATLLKEFLDSQRVPYQSILHPPAYTTQEVAATTHVPGHEMAKTVMVWVDGELSMVVLPASAPVNLDLLREAAGAHRVELASERDLRDIFPGCEVGAMPPFGNLYGIKVFVSDTLSRDEARSSSEISLPDLSSATVRLSLTVRTPQRIDFGA